MIYTLYLHLLISYLQNSFSSPSFEREVNTTFASLYIQKWIIPIFSLMESLYLYLILHSICITFVGLKLEGYMLYVHEPFSSFERKIENYFCIVVHSKVYSWIHIFFSSWKVDGNIYPFLVVFSLYV